jgi:hypothetical protein
MEENVIYNAHVVSPVAFLLGMNQIAGGKERTGRNKEER